MLNLSTFNHNNHPSKVKMVTKIIRCGISVLITYAINRARLARWINREVPKQARTIAFTSLVYTVPAWLMGSPTRSRLWRYRICLSKSLRLETVDCQTKCWAGFSSSFLL